MSGSAGSAWIALGFAILTGCVGPLVDEIELDAEAAEVLRGDVITYGSSELVDQRYDVIGPVEATSCFNNFITDQPASRDAAIDQMRLRARQHGGNGLANVVCERPRGTSLATNCWSSVTCYATAILLASDGGREASGDDRSSVSTGTAFFISSSGHAVTNAHVVHNCGMIVAHSDSRQFPLSLIALDSRNDLALVLAESAPGRHAQLGLTLRKGDPVVAVGFPLQGLLAAEPNVTTGVVSAMAGPRNDTSLFQMSAALQPGSSGGPILDQHGAVVGVAVGKLDAIRVAALTGDIPTNVNFGIKASVLGAFLDTKDV